MITTPHEVEAMMIHCDHIQKQELNIDRDLKHQRKLDEERIKEQDGIVRTLVRYMNEDLETISGSLSTPKDLKALGMLKEAVEIMLMQWKVVHEDFHLRQASVLDDSFPAYKQLLNEKLSLYFQFACATTGNKALLEKETITAEANDPSEARLTAQLNRVKNEVEVYKSIVQKEVDSSNDTRLKDPLFDRMLAALKAEKNKVEIYQLLLDQDVKYLNDNRLNGTLFEKGLHCNAPNKQYLRVKSREKFTPDC
jgi:hypothetical protein